MANVDTKIQSPNDEFFMRRCIQLALNAEGRTYPNPMVGAVVVCDGKIVGEGWHMKAGEPHAEVHAIGAVADDDLLRRSTIYVSLEPCAHQGRTPPCADLIIRKGIPNVVVGCMDSFSKVDGRGIRKLRAAGVNVVVGVLEDECRRLNRRFFTVQERKRPHVILKWAQTADGFMGLVVDGRPAPLRISNREAHLVEHRRRTTEDGILVGVGTVRSDDPRLTPRLWSGRAPLRFVLAPRLGLPNRAAMLTDGGRTVVINRVTETDFGSTRYVAREMLPGSVAADALDVVAGEGVSSLIVEGGARTLRTFIAEQLWDEAYVYVSNTHLGKGVEAPQLNGQIVSTRSFGECLLRHYVNDYKVQLPIIR